MTALDATPPGSVTPGPAAPPFAVIGGAQVQRALQGRERQVTELVTAAYRLHSAGDSVNPPSCFLRFPDRPSARIIALPASIGGQLRVDGVKWISSFPENVAAGLGNLGVALSVIAASQGYRFLRVTDSRCNLSTRLLSWRRWAAGST